MLYLVGVSLVLNKDFQGFFFSAVVFGFLWLIWFCANQLCFWIYLFKILGFQDERIIIYKDYILFCFLCSTMSWGYKQIIQISLYPVTLNFCSNSWFNIFRCYEEWEIEKSRHAKGLVPYSCHSWCWKTLILLTFILWTVILLRNLLFNNLRLNID